jgi:hypothetical protein
MQKDKAKSETVGWAVPTIARIACSPADEGLSPKASNVVTVWRERLPPMSFPRKRESMRAAAFLDPRFRGGDKKGTHSRFILLETPRQVTPGAALQTDDTPDSRPDVSTAPRRAAALRTEGDEAISTPRLGDYRVSGAMATLVSV